MNGIVPSVQALSSVGQGSGRCGQDSVAVMALIHTLLCHGL